MTDAIICYTGGLRNGCLISTIFSFVSLASLGPRIVIGTPTIERDLCRAAVLLRFALLSPEYEPEINIQSSQ